VSFLGLSIMNDTPSGGDEPGEAGLGDRGDRGATFVQRERVCGQGGLGAAVVIGNVDGPTDRGPRLAVSPGKVARRALARAERKPALSSAA
jgi:hypothetical protein